MLVQRFEVQRLEVLRLSLRVFAVAGYISFELDVWKVKGREGKYEREFHLKCTCGIKYELLFYLIISKFTLFTGLQGQE